MRILCNLLWWIFGGLEAAICYFCGSLILCCTIVGIPFGWQTFKIGLLCLWPFGTQVENNSEPSYGCLNLFLNIIWIICGGFLAWIIHIIFGLLLCITIIGIPFGRQHFKLAGLALTPFGKDVYLNI